MKLISVAILALAAYEAAAEKVVCFYNSKAFFRESQGKFTKDFIDPSLQICTHLIYGYAGIHKDTFKAVPLNEHFDITKNHYREITELKRRFPGLVVLLSVGGNEDFDGDDKYEKHLKYRTLVESVDNRLAFVNSAHALVKNYGFDGLDLSWEFPETKPRKIRGKFTSFFVGIKHKIVGESVIDDKAEEHKEKFTALVREIHNTFRHDGLLLTLTVLPNVNSSVYYDVQALSPQLEFITLNAFDFYTPARNPEEADYPSPLYELNAEQHKYKPDENVDYQVRYWTSRGAPSNKIILGIPTYGRAWKMTGDSTISGVPPLTVDGPAHAGQYSMEAGLLSYPEVCSKLANPQKLSQAQGKHLKKISDPSKRKEEKWIEIDVSKRFGVYAYRVPDASEDNGVWVGYEDPDTAGNKASYAKAKGLGGVAIVDITLDDFRGLCTGDKYPILRAAKYRL